MSVSFILPKKRIDLTKKSSTIPSDVLIDLNTNGRRNLFQYCDTCKAESGHFRGNKFAIKCCTCGKVTLL